jgi:hypothetical protein
LFEYIVEDIFTYPGFKGKEKGKLRLLFEANPMGKIITEAGGDKYNEKIGILSVMPGAIDEIIHIYNGGKKEIGLISIYTHLKTIRRYQGDTMCLPSVVFTCCTELRKILICRLAMLQAYF